MKIINGKQEDNNFVINSMEQTSNMFSISCDNKNPGKGYIKNWHKTFQQTIFDGNNQHTFYKKININKIKYLSSV